MYVGPIVVNATASLAFVIFVALVYARARFSYRRCFRQSDRHTSAGMRQN